jgi:hypothetical protein
LVAFENADIWHYLVVDFWSLFKTRTSGITLSFIFGRFLKRGHLALPGT